MHTILVWNKVYKDFHTLHTFMVKERIIGLSTTTSKFMVTLTKEVREKLGVKAGDKVVFIEKDGEIIIRKA